MSDPTFLRTLAPMWFLNRNGDEWVAVAPSGQRMRAEKFAFQNTRRGRPYNAPTAFTAIAFENQDAVDEFMRKPTGTDKRAGAIRSLQRYVSAMRQFETPSRVMILDEILEQMRHMTTFEPELPGGVESFRNIMNYEIGATIPGRKTPLFIKPKAFRGVTLHSFNDQPDLVDEINGFHMIRYFKGLSDERAVLTRAHFNAANPTPMYGHWGFDNQVFLMDVNERGRSVFVMEAEGDNDPFAVEWQSPLAMRGLSGYRDPYEGEVLVLEREEYPAAARLRWSERDRSCSARCAPLDVLNSVEAAKTGCSELPAS